MNTLGDALPKEIARVRDEVIPAYLQSGPGGQIVLVMMRADLDRAYKATIEGDLPGMIDAYLALKGYEL